MSSNLPKEMIQCIGEFSEEVAEAVFPAVKPRNYTDELMKLAIQNGNFALFKECLDHGKRKHVVRLLIRHQRGVEYFRLLMDLDCEKIPLHRVFEYSSKAGLYLIERGAKINSLVLSVIIQRHPDLTRFILHEYSWALVGCFESVFWKVVETKQREMIELLYSVYQCRPKNVSILEIL